MFAETSVATEGPSAPMRTTLRGGGNGRATSGASPAWFPTSADAGAYAPGKAPSRCLMTTEASEGWRCGSATRGSWSRGGAANRRDDSVVSRDRRRASAAALSDPSSVSESA